MRGALWLAVAALACGRGAFPDLGGAGAADAAASPADAGDAGDAVDAGSAADAGASADAGADAGPVVHAGVLFGVAGARYQSGSTSGHTDAQGNYSYEDGAKVSFFAGGLLLAEVAPAPLLTPFALAGGCSASPALRKLLSLLATIGPGLGALDRARMAGQRLADVDLATALAALAPGVTPVAEADALDAYIRSVDAEQWSEDSRESWSGLTAEQRTQGVAFTGAGWLFSWQLGLSRTDLAYQVQVNETAAIPAAMALQYGTNHIGDIDLQDQTLYAGMEDHPNYAHPRVGFFDAQSLSFERSVGLDHALQPDGVPWVAVWNGQLVTSAWNPAASINLFGMDGSTVGSIALRPASSRIQGAKVVGGMLYAARDTTPKEVDKIVLETGTALVLFTLPDVGEQEGIAVGSGMLHTLDIAPDKTTIELRHHRKVKPSIRDQVCPGS